MDSLNPLFKRLEVVECDITSVVADAIVNAASHSLLGNAGVSGTIFDAAGPELREECAALGGCASGDAQITGAYRLPARHVIHAVGPIWYGGVDREEDVLAQCYQRCLDIVQQYGHKTVPFPSIGTGSHGFPLERAAAIALKTITSFLMRNATVEKITIACYDKQTYDAYLAAYRKLLIESGS